MLTNYDKIVTLIPGGDYFINRVNYWNIEHNLCTLAVFLGSIDKGLLTPSDYNSIRIMKRLLIQKFGWKIIIRDNNGGLTKLSYGHYEHRICLSYYNPK